MEIIARKKEQRIIKLCYESKESEFVTIYGKKGIGKTYLVNNVFNNEFDFKFTAWYHASTKELIDAFQLELNKKTGKNTKTPKKWYEELDNLKEYLLSLKKDKVVVFIDELPWLDTNGSNFISAFSRFINEWNSDKCLLKLYTCGSATSWMINNLIGDKGGLHGRTTRQIHLAPFTLKEAEEYILKHKNANLSQKQILDLYMIIGGIPYYLNMIDYHLPIVKNIDNLFFDLNGPLRNEFIFLFESLFKNSNNYRKVIQTLSNKLYGMTREEIIETTKIEGGYLTEILENLIKCDFIRSYISPNKKTKGTVYQLIDLYSLFYLRFVDVGDGQDPEFWTHTNNTALINSWRGYAFEQVCLIHSEQIKKALGINGILSNIYSWKEKTHTENGILQSGGQIDLIIDRGDNVINVCEIKYSNDVFYISQEYEERIRKRTSAFIQSIKTKKSINNTFITTYGTSNSSIVDNYITFDKLFD